MDLETITPTKRHQIVGFLRIALSRGQSNTSIHDVTLLEVDRPGVRGYGVGSMARKALVSRRDLWKKKGTYGASVYVI